MITSTYRHVNLPAQVPLAWGAHRGASVIAEQLAGNKNIIFKGFLGTNIVKFFDYTLASVGIKVEELTHFDYQMVELMMSELTIDELTEFEVAYAPPYSHPKDLVNMIGYKARDL